MGLLINYGRVSSPQQANRGALERQEKQLLNSVPADESILDVGTGTNTSRTGYQRLCQLIGDGLVDEVRIADQDRLNRNVQADIEFFQLCEVNDTRITDLNGRELEMRTPDGELLSTVVSALNQHRSKLYRQKVKRALVQARKDGKPAVAQVPFGFRKVRDTGGRLVGIEPDPEKLQQVRDRVRWFISGETLSAVAKKVADIHKTEISTTALRRWFLAYPQLTGHLAWMRDKKTGEFKEIAEQRSFEPLITDAEAEQIQHRLKQTKTNKGLAGRKPRMLTGLCRCSCGAVLANNQARSGTLYLQCNARTCAHYGRTIRADRVFSVLQYSLMEHAKALYPLLIVPQTDPDGVGELRAEIKMLEAITGTEKLIEDKRQQINDLYANQTDTPAWLLIGALRSPMFWLQEDPKLNTILKFFIDRIDVQIGDSPQTGFVTGIQCRTSPSAAPLPPDQNNIVLRGGLADLVLAAHHQEKMQAALDAVC